MGCLRLDYVLEQSPRPRTSPLQSRKAADGLTDLQSVWINASIATLEQVFDQALDE